MCPPPHQWPAREPHARTLTVPSHGGAHRRDAVGNAAWGASASDSASTSTSGEMTAGLQPRKSAPFLPLQASGPLCVDKQETFADKSWNGPAVVLGQKSGAGLPRCDEPSRSQGISQTSLKPLTNARVFLRTNGATNVAAPREIPALKMIDAPPHSLSYFPEKI